MIAIVDCGMGNLHSVEAGLRRAGATAKIVSTAAEIDAADKVVLPGDGHFTACMTEIDKRQLRDALLRAATQKPFLGICIGMQVLYEGSDESPLAGLGLLSGRVCKLPTTGKIPHIGWNTVRQVRPHPFMENIPDLARFYFVHSYYAAPSEESIATTNYGADIAAVIAKDNLIAAQFHPEKSAVWGALLLKNFNAC
ncbi:MAG: imidazole glycerol phosphate synthase subunit HisH [Gammaproteobacteria bacterium WSBS_2016_MAG_OTU1]